PGQGAMRRAVRREVARGAGRSDVPNSAARVAAPRARAGAGRAEEVNVETALPYPVPAGQGRVWFGSSAGASGISARALPQKPRASLRATNKRRLHVATNNGTRRKKANTTSEAVGAGVGVAGGAAAGAAVGAAIGSAVPGPGTAIGAGIGAVVGGVGGGF